MSPQALIDRPDVVRRVENFKRLTLTDFKLDIPKLAKKKALKAALDENGKLSEPFVADTYMCKQRSRLSELGHTTCSLTYI